MKSYTAYQGIKFTIEWYVDDKGYSQAYEFFEQSSEAEQDKIIALFRLMGDRGKIFDETKFRNEDDGIFAFKYQQNRYLCFFFKGGKIIITNAFIKKSQKMPVREKSRALSIQKNYSKRIQEGTYYEQEN